MVNNFVKRTITGTIFVIIIVGAVLWNPWIFALLFLLISLGGLFEYLRMTRAAGLEAQRSLLLFVGVAVYGLIAMVLNGYLEPVYLLSGLLILPLFLAVELFRNKEKPFLNVATSLIGLTWIVVPLALLNGFFLKETEPGWMHSGALLGFFLILWIYDSGAYIFGSMLGRHRMLVRISPKKSWEGFIGGTLAGWLTAFLISASFREFTLVQWLLIGSVIIIFGTMGDLVESMLKRSTGVKDSGTLLPGHGGILDRFDAVFLAAPAVFLILQFLR
ncbi:MAG: phosphatidate cytidylyltransferase [Lentimicrobium sp.]|jgi:phosphatidate cytidylyltransferase|nr:phosphatidate cytidylyltransferase [Lentimicrobium sp.]